MWLLLLLASVAVAMAAGQEKQSDADVSDMDEDMGLDEEELKVLMAEHEEEATVMDEEQSDEMDDKDTESENAGKAATDAHVSFQVRSGSSKGYRVIKEQMNMVCITAFIYVLQVTYKTPVPTGDVYFAETFDDGTLGRYRLRTLPPSAAR